MFKLLQDSDYTDSESTSGSDYSNPEERIALKGVDTLHQANPGGKTHPMESSDRDSVCSKESYERKITPPDMVMGSR